MVNYIVVIDVANPELKLLPGLTANISINVQEHDNVLKVLSNAIHFTPSADYMKTLQLPDSLIKKITSLSVASNEIPVPNSYSYIWLKKGDEIYPTLVKNGLFDGNYIEIAGDIKEGEEVITGISGEASTSTTAKNQFMPQMRPPRR